MTLDPQARAMLDQMVAAGLPDVVTLTPREARAQMEVGTMLVGPPAPVARVVDRPVAGADGHAIPLRITAPEGEGPWPGLIYLHGGGWVTGSIRTHDHICRAITLAAGAVVVSVDYRLAPEHPFPTAVHDAEAATAWVAAHTEELGIDPARLSIGGDSAGGNLATVVARHARDRGGPRLATQVLIYPVTDSRFDTGSYAAYADGYFLTRDAMHWYWNHYLPDLAQRDDPDAAPLRAASLVDLPPALLVTAGHDPLRDEGEAYARRLAEAGVAVRLTRYPGMVHAFLRWHATWTQSHAALLEIAAVVRGGTIDPRA